MLKFKIPNIKNLMSKKAEGNNKKNIENLIVFLVLLVITIIAINSIWGSKSSNTTSVVNSMPADIANQNNISNNSAGSEYDLERKLEDILSKISGVRKSKGYAYIF
ncbi:MAG: hypothetical protein FWC53_03095 [Firmicutes bacterium]|nr:hypothetical protein [Bacillota bacterium]